MKRTVLSLGIVLAATIPIKLTAGLVYWDIDGATTAGAGSATPTGNWGTGTANWGNSAGTVAGANWVNANGDTAVFAAGTNATGAYTVTVNTPITLAGITREEGSPTISASSANVLTFTNGALAVDSGSGTLIVNAFYGPTNGVITKTGTGIFSSGTSQSTFAGKWVVNAGILSVAGDLRLGVVPGAVVPDQVTLNGGFIRSSTAAVVFDAKRGITLTAVGGGFDSTAATQTWSGPITGSAGGPLIKNGTVNLTLNNNASDYDGTTFINSGRLTIGAANALGLTSAGTEVSVGAGVVYTGAAATFTTAEPFKLAGVGGGDNGAIAVLASANVNFSGPITLSGDTTITVSSSASATFSNPAAFTSLANQNLTLIGGSNPAGVKLITGAIALGTGSLTKLEGGNWTLAGTNTYSGTTTIGAGTLQLGTGLAGGDGTIANSPSVINSSALIFNRFGSDNYGGVISGAGSLTKTGVGTQTLSGANTYTGVTRITDGVLSVATIGNGGVVSGNLGSATNAASNLVFDGGTLQYTGANAGTDRNFTINAGKTATFDITTNNLTLNGGSTATTGALTKTGLGTLTLAQTNTFTGGTTVNQGTLAATVAGSLGSTSGITVNNLGTLLLAGANNIDRINNLATVSLASGSTFNTGGLNEGPAAGASGASAEMGVLTLSATSTIDFTSATSSNLLFTNLLYTPGDLVNIRNWTGTVNTDDGSASNDRLLFTGNPGFSDLQLASFQFYDDLGTAFDPGATLISFNGYSELVPLVPVPEPSAVVGALALLGLAGYRERRRAAALRRASRQV